MWVAYEIIRVRCSILAAVQGPEGGRACQRGYCTLVVKKISGIAVEIEIEIEIRKAM